MKPAMPVSTRGTCSRSRPRSRSATGVVAARTIAGEHAERALGHDVPCPPQARLRQRDAEHVDPGRRRRPRAGTRRRRGTGPRCADGGRQGPCGSRASAATPTMRAAATGKAQTASRGVATTRKPDTTVATILTWAGSRCTTLSPAWKRPVGAGVRRPHVSWRRGPQPTAGGGSSRNSPPAMANVTVTPEQAGEAGAQPLVVDPLDARSRPWAGRRGRAAPLLRRTPRRWRPC